MPLPGRKLVHFSLNSFLYVIIIVALHVLSRNKSQKPLALKGDAFWHFYHLIFRLRPCSCQRALLALQPCCIRVGRVAQFRSSNADRRRGFAGTLTPPLSVAS